MILRPRSTRPVLAFPPRRVVGVGSPSSLVLFLVVFYLYVFVVFLLVPCSGIHVFLQLVVLSRTVMVSFGVWVFYGVSSCSLSAAGSLGWGPWVFLLSRFFWGFLPPLCDPVP